MDDTPKEAPSSEKYPRGVKFYLEYIEWPRLPLRCPCCGCKTLKERGMFEICAVCFWEDDGQDDRDADLNQWFGPNRGLSLSQARANYLQFGACEKGMLNFVRPPRPEELPEEPQSESSP